MPWSNDERAVRNAVSGENGAMKSNAKTPLCQSKSEWAVNKGSNQGLRYLSKLKKNGVWVTRPYHLVVFLTRQLDSVVKIQSIAAHTFIPLRFKI